MSVRGVERRYDDVDEAREWAAGDGRSLEATHARDEDARRQAIARYALAFL
jgi:hypothetical protein